MTRLFRLSAVLALLCFPVVGVTQEKVRPKDRVIAQLYNELARTSQQVKALERRIVAMETLVDELAKAEP